MAATTTQTRPADAGPTAKRDFRQEVTDRIVEMLEKGVAPWQKPWNPGEASVGIPFNPTTDRAYRGGNAIHLMATGLNRGYADPRWMTYKQAADRGWQVRRGEKGTQIEFWDVKPARDKESAGSDGDQRERGKKGEARLIHRVYTVFNAKQIEGIPQYQPRQRTPFEMVQSGESILEHSGADIRHDQADRAFYSRTSDTIHLPPKEAFKDATGYYGTALHELSHWSGHPSRLNRITLNESYRFGDTNYAKEELRAELASVFLAAERGIPHDPAQHAAYVGSWIKTLREDKNEIFRAAHDASLASDFLLSLERDRSIANEELAAGPTLDSTTNPGALETAYEQESSNLQRDREDLIDESIPQEPANGSRTKEPLLKQVAALTWKTDATLTPEGLVNALGTVNDAGGRFLIYQNTCLSAPDAIKAHQEFTDKVHALQNEPLSSLDKRDAAYRAGYSFSTLLSALVLSRNPEAFSILDSAEPLLSSEPVRSSFVEGFARNVRNRYTEDDERFPGSSESRQRAAEREQFIQAMQRKLGCGFENTGVTARLEPDSGTVRVEEKQTGTQRRNTVEIHGASATGQNQARDKSDEFSTAHAITTNALGQSARSVGALVNGGNYRGVVLGETECYLVQRQSSGMAVLHQKDLLDRQPQVGEVFSINYSNGRGVVHEFRERAKANELSR
jgi:antirestriction protein ArdC